MASDENLKPALVVFGVMLATAAVALIVKHRVNADESEDETTVMVERFERFTDDMCACKTAKCAQGVSERMTAWATDAAKHQANQPPPSDKAMQQRMTVIAERMATCMQKAMTTSD